MCRKFIYCMSFILVMALVGVANADIVSGLVGHWQFEGDFTDSSGNGNHGQAIGNTAIVSDADRGRVAELDGAGDYIEIPNSDTLNITGNEITLAAWVYFDDVSGPPEIIIAKVYQETTHASPYFSYGLHILSNGQPRFWLRLGTASRNVPGTVGMIQSQRWYHVAGVYTGSQMILYVDGQAVATRDYTGNITGYDTVLRLGTNGGLTEQMDGKIDDVRIYNRALPVEDIAAVMVGAPAELASSPTPPDGAENVIEPLFKWTPGSTAAFHDVYLGTNPTLGPADLVSPRYTYTTYWHVPGLTSGTTYYWRIDEVEADGVTIHTGDVWSFTTATLTAYNPDPPDGATFVDTEANLSWSAGAGAITHDVYFGTDESAVTDATTASPEFKVNQPLKTYEPGTLAKGTTYYWRIDEVEADGTTKHKGDVWWFRTMPDMPISDPELVGWWKLDEGSGTVALDWSGHDHHGTLVGPEWAVEGYDGGALDFDGVDDLVELGVVDVVGGGITLAAWIKPDDFGIGDARMITKADEWGENNHWWMMSTNAVGGGYGVRFRLKTDDGQNTTTLIAGSGGLIAGEWAHVATTWDGATMRTYENAVETGSVAKGGTAVATDPAVKAAIGSQPADAWASDPTHVAKYFDGLIDDVRIYSRAYTAAELPDIMIGDPTLASKPSPANGATTDIEKATPLSWTAGEKAAQHDVYLGTDQAAVASADTATADVYRGRQNVNSYTPPEGVEFGQTYYWRIDEVNTDGTISTGRIWSFTVAEYLIVDDMESYDDVCNRIFFAWLDGFGHSGDPDCGVAPYNGNGTGSTVGNLNPPFAEQTTVNSGLQSMPMGYDNRSAPFYSEAELPFAVAQDWTRRGVKALVLYFHGDSGNAAEPLYVAVQDSTGKTAVVKHGQPDAVQLGSWQEWNIALKDFAGVNLRAIKKLIIGAGDRLAPRQGGQGSLFIDDIRLYPPRCMPGLLKTVADLNSNCVVDYPDLQIIANQWLTTGHLVTPVQPGSAGLVARYQFEGNTNDSSGNSHHGTFAGVAFYMPGPTGLGTALQFDGAGNVLQLGTLDVVGPGISLSAWVRPDDFEVADGRIISKATGSGENEHWWMLSPIGTDHTLRFRLKTNDGQNTVTLIAGSGGLAAAQWAHAAATWDGSTMRLYKDGKEVGSRSKGGTAVATDPTVGVAVGNQPTGATGGTRYYDGLIDEVRIYSRALSETEIAWLAGITAPFSEPFDLSVDGAVDFTDFAILADSWLDELLWPQP